MQDDRLRLAVQAGGLSVLVVLIATQGVNTLWRDTLTLLPPEVQSAATFFIPSITAAQIQKNYDSVSPEDSERTTRTRRTREQKVRVLIVPGHQPEVGGTTFDGLYERDIVVDIADALAELLATNPHYEVLVARGKESWNPVLQLYFDTRALEIEKFIQSQKLQMEKHLARGTILPEADQVYHNTTSAQGALQLYGINKWAGENNIDITLHIHLNDYAGRRARSVGTYDGFSIYVPDLQYSNGAASKEIGMALAARLNAYHATSTLRQERIGVIEDQDLIAIGSNNTSDAAAILVEYAYIYEPQFRVPAVRALAVVDYAHQTYLGLQDFFDDPVPATFGTVSFPYDWSKVSLKTGVSGPGVYALQAALHHLGFYPANGDNFSECPISGKVGSCTRTALKAYQEVRGLDVTGTLGPKTRAALEQDLATP